MRCESSAKERGGGKGGSVFSFFNFALTIPHKFLKEGFRIDPALDSSEEDEADALVLLVARSGEEAVTLEGRSDVTPLRCTIGAKDVRSSPEKPEL
jgi:hypothetical protein